MSSRKRHFWTAIAAGVVVSGALLGLSFAVNPDHHRALNSLLFMAQYPGWIACVALLPGSFESVSTTNYVAIAVPLNAVLYATIIFAGLRLLSRKTRQSGNIA